MEIPLKGFKILVFCKNIYFLVNGKSRTRGIKWQNVCWYFNWKYPKYPTIYSAHLHKSANYLGYYWKKLSYHVHENMRLASEIISFRIIQTRKTNWLDKQIMSLKSVHSKKTVARSSFLSKLWYLLLLLYWKVPQFWKKWGLRNCLLKMNGL